MNFFSRILETIFQNALSRLVFWFLLGAIFAILLIRIFKSQSRAASSPQKALNSEMLQAINRRPALSYYIIQATCSDPRHLVG
jgi:hypothetical protein